MPDTAMIHKLPLQRALLDACDAENALELDIYAALDHSRASARGPGREDHDPSRCKD